MDFTSACAAEYLRLADVEPERIVVIDGVGMVDEVFRDPAWRPRAERLTAVPAPSTRPWIPPDR